MTRLNFRQSHARAVAHRTIFGRSARSRAGWHSPPSDMEVALMSRSPHLRRAGVLLAAGGLAVSGLVALPSTAAPPAKPNPVACDNRNNNTYDKLLGCVSGDGAMEHLEAFQAIADEHG